MRKRIDLTGQRFGRLVVVREVGRRQRHPLWELKCDCGNTHYCITTSLRSGRTKSCGCLNREQKSQIRTHGESKSRLYHIYHAMLQRCYDKSFKYYDCYGGRGIKICEEWQSYEPFRDWALSHGYEDGLSIEREDVNRDYCPDNCKWIPLSQQANNRRNTRYVEYQGETITLKELADLCGVDRHMLYWRIVKLGWSVEDAINRPIEKKSRPSVCETEKAAKEKICYADYTAERTVSQ